MMGLSGNLESNVIIAQDHTNNSRKINHLEQDRLTTAVKIQFLLISLLNTREHFIKFLSVEMSKKRTPATDVLPWDFCETRRWSIFPAGRAPLRMKQGVCSDFKAASELLLL